MFKNPVDVIDEAHAEHFVRFIENQRLKTIELEVAFFDVVHDSAGSSDNHLSATLEFAYLLSVARSPVDRNNSKLGQVFRITLDRFGYLQGEFAGRDKAKDFGTFDRFIDSGKQGQREGCCLTRSRLGNPKQIGSFQ